MSDHPVPKTQIETLNKVIEGYYEAAEIGEVVEDEDVEEESEYSDDVISRQKKFLADVGILDKDGYDYTLLEPGYQIGRALAFDRESDAKEVFRELLKEWEVTGQLKEDLDDREVDEEEVVDSLAYLTETDLSSPRKKTGLSALVDIYSWTDILSETNDGKYRFSSEPQQEMQKAESTEDKGELQEPTEQESTEQESTASSTEQAQNISANHSSQKTTIADGTVSVDIELSGDEDPQNVKELIIAVREGLQEEIKFTEEDDKKDSAGHQPQSSFDTDE